MARTRSEGTPDRHALLLDTAAAMFLRDGYASTTMDDIARAAGVSKKTLYQLFPSKLSLLEMMLHSRFSGLPWPQTVGGRTVEERLISVMLPFASKVLTPEHVALARMIIAGGKDAPVLSDAFRRIAIERDLEALDSFLSAEAIAQHWTFPADELRRLSRVLFATTVGDLLMERLFYLSDPGKPQADIESRVRNGVAFFLRGLETSAAKAATDHQPPRTSKSVRQRRDGPHGRR